MKEKFVELEVWCNVFNLSILDIMCPINFIIKFYVEFKWPLIQWIKGQYDYEKIKET